MNELTTYQWSFLEDVFHYKECGYSAIGVWRRKFLDFGEEKAAELLLDTGLSVSNLFWAGGFTGSDGRSYQESIDDAKKAIQTARTINAGCLVICTGGRNNHIDRHAQRLLFGAFDSLLPFAESLNVTLAIEPMHESYSKDWTLLTDLGLATEVLDKYNSDHLKLVLDTYHMGHSPNLIEHLEKIADSVAIVHLGDCRGKPKPDQDRCNLGGGDIPLVEIISALLRGGYQGDFDIELVGFEINSNCYVDVLKDSQKQATEIIATAKKSPASFTAR